MIGTVLRKMFGTRNDREIRRIEQRVSGVNTFEERMRARTDADLAGLTADFRRRLDAGEPLDDLLPEAFAAVREASRRVLGMRHYDVQLIGGAVLHEGRIAEMKTGEGKTLVATLPVYLNALTGKGVHVVTVNDYLAKRDSEWMGRVYRFMGLSVGIIQHHLDDAQRKEAYQADVTYGTNNEYGFDYLRDNMKYRMGDLVQRNLHYAIVDEVDSILIDEARTPLIISGPVEETTDLYFKINRIIPSLHEGTDYAIDEKARSAILTEEGVAHTEKLLGIDNLYDPANTQLLHHVSQGLRAHTLYKRDVEYVVKDGEVIIVDEFTGRLMPGRRWSEGLHQAVEAKEGVKIAQENQTLATITFQNYFRMYDKLAGMTGTADTESVEFKKIYNLEVVIIPTNRPLIRNNQHDQIYRTEREKFEAVVGEIKRLHGEGRPVLVGTISIEKSERLASMLKRQGIRHEVLNAKYHEKEAEIISQAGRKGAVTIATNMAGRGTDILLGGNPEAMAGARFRSQGEEGGKTYEQILAEFRTLTEGEHREVVEAGGLHIIGTERHESRRIDNQLRGRAGRQGDPGSSRFYLSLEDDLLRIFGSERISSIMSRIGMEEGEPIEHGMVTRAIENAQKRVEAHNFDIRKQLLEYDDVMNQQREHVYRQRRQILAGEDIHADVLDMIEEVASGMVGIHCLRDGHPDEWDRQGLATAIRAHFALHELPAGLEELRDWEALNTSVVEAVTARYAAKEAEFGGERLRDLERYIMLQVLDGLWKEHLYSMDALKEGIGLRGYGQKNPLVEYKREGYDMFNQMVQRIRDDLVGFLFHVEMERPLEERHRPVPRPDADRIRAVKAVAPSLARQSESQEAAARTGEAITVRRQQPKVGRNDPCPCGSGKKFKKCCGAES
jgi:preprotein translocase subunit SecA